MLKNLQFYDGISASKNTLEYNEETAKKITEEGCKNLSKMLQKQLEFNEKIGLPKGMITTMYGFQNTDKLN